MPLNYADIVFTIRATNWLHLLLSYSQAIYIAFAVQIDKKCQTSNTQYTHLFLECTAKDVSRPLELDFTIMLVDTAWVCDQLTTILLLSKHLKCIKDVRYMYIDLEFEERKNKQTSWNN